MRVCVSTVSLPGEIDAVHWDREREDKRVREWCDHSFEEGKRQWTLVCSLFSLFLAPGCQRGWTDWEREKENKKEKERGESRRWVHIVHTHCFDPFCVFLSPLLVGLRWSVYMSGTFTLTWADAPDFLQRVYPLTHLWDDELKQICICKLNAKKKWFWRKTSLRLMTDV